MNMSPCAGLETGCPALETQKARKQNRTLREVTGPNHTTQIRQITCYPIVNEYGEVAQFVVAIRDMTKDLVERIEKRTQAIKKDLAHLVQVESKKIDLPEVFNTILLLPGHQLELANIRCEVNLPAPPFTAWGDYTQIQQCLPNLMFNAIDAMPGGGTITISGGTDEALEPLTGGARFRLGVAQFDLCTPILGFVFGESQLGGKAAVISLHRLEHKDPGQMYLRAAKIGLHEIGHLLGIGHCRAPNCLMNFSGNLGKLDTIFLSFCSSCEFEIARSLRHCFGRS